MKAILTFHSIDDSGSVLSFPIAKFEQLVNQLSCSDITICPLDELLEPNIDNALAITFDDGMISVFEHALPILRNANVPSHLYLTTGAVGKDNRWPTQPAAAPYFNMMSWDQIEACVEAGVNLEAHTHTHPWLTRLNDEAIIEECELADNTIEKKFGRKPRHFAYPYGDVNRHVCDVVGARYKGCVTTELRPLPKSVNAALLPRWDSYYLQHSSDYKNLFSFSHMTYMNARYLMRKVRAWL